MARLFLGTHDEERRLALLDELAKDVGALGQRGASRNVLIADIADAYEVEPKEVSRLIEGINLIKNKGNSKMFQLSDNQLELLDKEYERFITSKAERRLADGEESRSPTNEELHTHLQNKADIIGCDILDVAHDSQASQLGLQR